MLNTFLSSEFCIFAQAAILGQNPPRQPPKQTKLPWTKPPGQNPPQTKPPG